MKFLGSCGAMTLQNYEAYHEYCKDVILHSKKDKRMFESINKRLISQRFLCYYYSEFDSDQIEIRPMFSTYSRQSNILSINQSQEVFNLLNDVLLPNENQYQLFKGVSLERKNARRKRILGTR